MITAHRSGITITICGLLTVLSFVHGTPVGDCRRWNPLKRAYHLADDKDCTVFYKCVRTWPIKLVCPEGLHFNRRLEVCDWPATAGCSEYKVSPTRVAHPSPGIPRPLKRPSEICPAPVACPTYDNGKFAIHVPHPYNCSKFCKCNRGQPVAIDCPAGLHFNPALEVCDWPETAGCSVITVRTEVDPSTRTHSTIPTGDCITAENITTTDTPKADPSTPEGLTTTLCGTEIISGDCPAIGVCPQYEDEKSIVKHLPHANNCSQFCTCRHGVPIKFDCPVGLHFNPVLEVCDWPQNSNCSSTLSSRLLNTPRIVPATFETDPIFTDTTTDFPTSTTELSTGHTYESDTSTEDITTTELATTELTTTDLTTTELTTGATNTSAKPTNNFPTQTTQQFATETGVATTVTDDTTVVPESTVWLETSTSTASWPTDTTTIIATAATVLPRDENACAIIKSCPIYNQQSVVKHLPHPTNCSLYCRCNHGAAITERCPVGLHFNAKLEVCDWPRNANCK